MCRRPLGSAAPRSCAVNVSVTLKGRVGDENVDVVSEELGLETSRSGMRATLTGERFDADFGDDPALLALLFPMMPPVRPGSAQGALRQRFEDRFPPQEVLGDKAQLRLLTRSLGSVFNAIRRQCAVTRLRLDASALRSDARHQPDAGQALGPSGEGLPVAVDRLRERRAEPAAAFRPILDTLREVYPRIEDVVPESFGQGRVTLNFRERGITDPIPLDGVSDGVLHALALLIALDSHREGVLAIEEPENALHPWSVRKILEVAQERQGAQVLITTHSETVVNAVRDPQSLFIVEGDDQQGTTVEPATSKDSALEAILQESGQKLGDVWVGGSLGGVP